MVASFELRCITLRPPVGGVKAVTPRTGMPAARCSMSPRMTYRRFGVLRRGCARARSLRRADHVVNVEPQLRVPDDPLDEAVGWLAGARRVAEQVSDGGTRIAAPSRLAATDRIVQAQTAALDQPQRECGRGRFRALCMGSDVRGVITTRGRTTATIHRRPSGNTTDAAAPGMPAFSTSARNRLSSARATWSV